MSGAEPGLLQLEGSLGVVLPDDYRQFLSASDGLIEEMPQAYVELWALDDVVTIHDSDAYGLDESLPGLLLIGGDGGGELLAFDLRQAPFRLVLVNAISASWSEAAYQADSLTDLLAHLRAGGEFSFESDGTRAP